MTGTIFSYPPSEILRLILMSLTHHFGLRTHPRHFYYPRVLFATLSARRQVRGKPIRAPADMEQSIRTSSSYWASQSERAI